MVQQRGPLRSGAGTERLVHSAISYALKRAPDVRAGRNTTTGPRQPSVTLVHKGNIMKFTEGAFKDWGYKVATQYFRKDVVTERESWILGNHEAAAAKLAMLTGRPIKAALTRDEVFYCHRGRHPVLMWLKTGWSNDGKLLGLDETRMAWALGIAGSHSAGLMEFVWEGAMTKRLHEGRAAANGLESALLAQLGFTGPTTVMEGELGYLKAVSPTPHPERLTEQLGTRWLGDHRPMLPAGRSARPGAAWVGRR